MRFLLTATALGSLLCLPVAAQRPDSEQQKRTLDSAREIALHYSSKLPDFICTEQIHRTDRTGPTNLQSDSLTIQLTYSGQNERQKLVAINGKPTQQPLESLGGLITGGQFGSLLIDVFAPSSAAEFQWKKSSNVGKRASTVYAYRIARSNSHYKLGRRLASGNMAQAPAGYHGEVVLDGETNRVLRLTAIADDIPKESGILQSSVEVDYDFIDVAGQSYLLPSRSEAHMERAYRQIGNMVKFVDYRKFQVDATIDFSPPKN